MNKISNLRPWKVDFHSLGVMLPKLLTRDCKFIMTPDSMESSLHLYAQVHHHPKYKYEDQDVGVPPDLTFSSSLFAKVKF